MTEGEWLACDDPRRMLQYGAGDGEFHLAGVPCRHPRKEWYSDRKLRLFACACLAFTNKPPALLHGDYGPEGEGIADPAFLADAWCVRNLPGDVLTAALRAGLLRCIFGNPFRPGLSHADLARHGVLDWNGNSVPRLATAIYTENRWDDLPYLADALEEADCADEEILGHCRGPGPHARGCWVADLILGKS